MEERALRELDSVGYAILPQFVSLDEAAVLRRATLPIPVFKHLSDFGGSEGLFVSHVHNLLGKTRAFDELVLHPTMLSIAERHLGTEDIQLNITGMLDTVPGQRGQRFHRATPPNHPNHPATRHPPDRLPSAVYPQGTTAPGLSPTRTHPWS